MFKLNAEEKHRFEQSLKRINLDIHDGCYRSDVEWYRRSSSSRCTDPLCQRIVDELESCYSIKEKTLVPLCPCTRFSYTIIKSFIEQSLKDNS